MMPNDSRRSGVAADKVALAGSERLERDHDQQRSLILHRRTLRLRRLETALPQLTHLVAERIRLRRRSTVKQLGPPMRSRRSSMSSELPLHLRTRRGHSTSSRAMTADSTRLCAGTGPHLRHDGVMRTRPA